MWRSLALRILGYNEQYEQKVKDLSETKKALNDLVDQLTGVSSITWTTFYAVTCVILMDPLSLRIKCTNTYKLKDSLTRHLKEKHKIKYT